MKIFKKKNHAVYVTETDRQVTEAEPLLPDNGGNHCLWPQPGFKIIAYTTELVYSTGPEDMPESEASDVSRSKKEKTKEYSLNLSGHANNMIKTKKEFRSFSEYINLDVDWNKEKIAFYTECTTYKHGKLDSDYTLMGLSLSADGKTLCLGYRSTFYGVCQGVVQLPEWYSSKINTYAIVIPGTVEKITSITCYFGSDCSGIP